MSHRAVLSAYVAAALLPIQVQAQNDSLVNPYSADECPSCAEWNAPQRPVHLFGNTYYVGTRGLGSLLITSPQGHVLIDGGLPDSAPLILANVRALGFDPSEVKFILNSHAHFDHAGGIAALQRATEPESQRADPALWFFRRGGPEQTIRNTVWRSTCRRCGTSRS